MAQFALWCRNNLRRRLVRFGPIADIRGCGWQDRFVPIADIACLIGIERGHQLKPKQKEAPAYLSQRPGLSHT
jgi:hypothetical protein